jgi:hypothetical protein
MADSSVSAVNRPLLVCGMHRSGTSLTASLFHAAGVRLGDRLLGANVGNDRGHFEDLDIYEFHQAALRSNGLGTEGYVAGGTVVVPEPLEPIGRRLAADRARGGGVWGWKEPRTVLFLDYWDAILPAARYVFVFRRPWEVVDSLFRRGDDTFAGNPAFAAEVWLHYNRTILEFARRHRDRCLVVEIDRVAVDPSGLFTAVRSHLGIALADPPDLFEPRLLVGDGDPGHALAIRACLPEAQDVYHELRSLAGADPGAEAGAVDVDRVALGRRLLGEWRRMRRAEAQVADLLGQVSSAREAAATLRGSMTDLEGERQRLEAVRTEQAGGIAVLQTELAGVRAQHAARIAALEAERTAQTAAATAVQSLEREIAGLRGELHERETVLAWMAARLQSREGSVLRRIRREGRRIAAQAAAVLRRICGRQPAPAADRDPRIGQRDAA